MVAPDMALPGTVLPGVRRSILEAGRAGMPPLAPALLATWGTPKLGMPPSVRGAGPVAVASAPVSAVVSPRSVPLGLVRSAGAPFGVVPFKIAPFWLGGRLRPPACRPGEVEMESAGGIVARIGRVRGRAGAGIGPVKVSATASFSEGGRGNWSGSLVRSARLGCGGCCGGSIAGSLMGSNARATGDGGGAGVLAVRGIAGVG